MSDNESAGSKGEEDQEVQENPVIELPELFYYLHRNDEFMMKEFKSVDCPEVVQDMDLHHDFFCPFFHPGQTRRRRPHWYKYSPKICENIRQCPLGDACGFAHNIYEYCLHPKKYRNSSCFYGQTCMIFPCLFCHNPEKLRASMKPPLPVPPSPRRPPLLPLPPLRIPPPRQGGRPSTSRSKSI